MTYENADLRSNPKEVNKGTRNRWRKKIQNFQEKSTKDDKQI